MRRNAGTCYRRCESRVLINANAKREQMVGGIGFEYRSFVEYLNELSSEQHVRPAIPGDPTFTRPDSATGSIVDGGVVGGGGGGGGVDGGSDSWGHVHYQCVWVIVTRLGAPTMPAFSARQVQFYLPPEMILKTGTPLAYETDLIQIQVDQPVHTRCIQVFFSLYFLYLFLLFLDQQISALLYFSI